MSNAKAAAPDPALDQSMPEVPLLVVVLLRPAQVSRAPRPERRARPARHGRGRPDELEGPAGLEGRIAPGARARSSLLSPCRALFAADGSVAARSLAATDRRLGLD